MIISWFEKRVRKNVNDIFSIVHGEEVTIPPTPPVSALEGVELLPPEVQMRVEELKKWRKNLASLRGIAPYRIFNNRTLLHLAVKNPLTLEELEEIHGIKEKRKNDYGTELIEMLKKQELP